MCGILYLNYCDLFYFFKDGLTALCKAVIGRKHAITNCLLRNSANPFVQDNVSEKSIVCCAVIVAYVNLYLLIFLLRFIFCALPALIGNSSLLSLHLRRL